MAATSVGNYAIFAGGFGRLGDSAAIDTYNSKTRTWSTAWLSEARENIAVATVGHFALFAGGFNGNLGASDIVDIFNADTGEWSNSKLFHPSILDATAVIGDKVLFDGAGEGTTDNIDVVDAATVQWSTAKLSRPRSGMKVTVIGSKAIFAGGYIITGRQSGFPFLQSVDDVDIYDASTDQWSTAHLARARAVSAVATVGNLAMFAGGVVSTNTIIGQGAVSADVDIYDASTGHWSTATLSEARSNLVAESSKGVAIFAAGDRGFGPGFSNVVDIYDAVNNQWSATALPEGLDSPGATALGRDILIAGGGGLTAESNLAAVFNVGTGILSTGTLSQARGEMAAIMAGRTAIFAGGAVMGRHGGTPVTNAVDLFTYDDTPPTTLVTAPPLTNQQNSYTFSIAYHDEFKIDAATLDHNDIIVTGPNGFSGPAHFISQSKGRHGSTRIATYSVSSIVSWNISNNGTYEIHLQADEVKDTAQNAAIGRRIGSFKIAIPTTSNPPLGHTTATLSQARKDLAAVSVANKALFAGGESFNTDSDIVDIYDVATKRWSIAHLSQARGNLTATAVAGKALFAGGDGHNFTGDSDVVDIYDSATNQWSTAHLSQPRSHAAAVTVGDKAIFAGDGSGIGSDIADIFSAATDSWSSIKLPRALSSPVATVVGGKAIFVDRSGSLIYDSAIGQWLSADLPSPQATFNSAATVGTMAIFATQGAVDIYDDLTGQWSQVPAPQIGAETAAASLGSKALFTWFIEADIYEPGTGAWSAASTDARHAEMAATSLGTRAFFAGGTAVFAGGWLDTIDIFTDTNPSPNLDGVITQANKATVTVTIHNTGDDALPGPFTVSIYGSRAGHHSILLGTATVQRALRSGTTRELTVSLTFPRGTSLSDYHLYAQTKNRNSRRPITFATRDNLPQAPTPDRIQPPV